MTNTTCIFGQYAVYELDLKAMFYLLNIWLAHCWDPSSIFSACQLKWWTILAWHLKAWVVDIVDIGITVYHRHWT